MTYFPDAGIDNAGLDDGEIKKDEERSSDVQKDENSDAIYANMLDISHSVPVTGLAAYVEENSGNSGFQKEFGVGCLFNTICYKFEI